MHAPSWMAYVWVVRCLLSMDEKKINDPLKVELELCVADENSPFPHDKYYT